MKLNGKIFLYLSIFSLFSILLISNLSHLNKTIAKLSSNYQNSNSKYQKASKIFNEKSENGLLNGTFGKILFLGFNVLNFIKDLNYKRNLKKNKTT
jgi:hypothetical protein